MYCLVLSIHQLHYLFYFWFTLAFFRDARLLRFLQKKLLVCSWNILFTSKLIEEYTTMVRFHRQYSVVYICPNVVNILRLPCIFVQSYDGCGMIMTLL